GARDHQNFTPVGCRGRQQWWNVCPPADHRQFRVGRTTLGHGPFGPIPAASGRAPVPLQACGACPHQDHVGQVTQQCVHHQVGFGVDGGRPAVVAHGCTVEGGDHVRACPRTCRGVGVGVELFECVLVGASVWCRYFGGGLV